jgi:hypothetical protein
MVRRRRTGVGVSISFVPAIDQEGVKGRVLGGYQLAGEHAVSAVRARECAAVGDDEPRLENAPDPGVLVRDPSGDKRNLTSPAGERASDLANHEKVDQNDAMKVAHVRRR